MFKHLLGKDANDKIFDNLNPPPYAILLVAFARHPTQD